MITEKENQENVAAGVGTETPTQPVAAKVEMSEEDMLLAQLSGQAPTQELSEKEQALLAEYSSKDDVSLDASDLNDSIGGSLPSLKPTVVDKPNGGKKITLPIGFLSNVEVRFNEKADSKGYYVGLKRAKLRFEFNGFKANPVDPNSGHVETIEPIKGNLDKDVKATIIRKQLSVVNELAEAYGVMPLLRSVDQISRDQTIAAAAKADEAGSSMSQAEFDLTRYANTYKLWAIIFNNGRTKPDGTKMPVYKNPNIEEGVTDGAGNPKNAIPLRLHIISRDNRWQLSWAPAIELFNPTATKSKLEVDPSRYSYEKSSNDNAGGGGTDAPVMGAEATDTIALDEEMNFEDLANS